MNITSGRRLAAVAVAAVAALGAAAPAALAYTDRSDGSAYYPGLGGTWLRVSTWQNSTSPIAPDAVHWSVSGVVVQDQPCGGTVSISASGTGGGSTQSINTFVPYPGVCAFTTGAVLKADLTAQNCHSTGSQVTDTQHTTCSWSGTSTASWEWDHTAAQVFGPVGSTASWESWESLLH